jgi:hypothetical protein
MLKNNNKNNTIMERVRKVVVVFVLALFFASAVFAQEGSDDAVQVVNTAVKSRVRVPENAIVFNLGYSIPMLDNAMVKNSFWDKKLGTGMDFSLGFRRHFMQRTIEDDEVVNLPTWFAVGAGVGVSYFHQSIGFGSLRDTLTSHTDVDGDNCDVYFNFQNVKEAVSLMYLDIPVYLEFGKPDRMKTSAFFKVGVKASLLLSENVAGEGFYKSEGFYPKWNVKLHNINPLGYYNNADCYSENESEYNLSPFVLWGSVSGGVNIPLSSVKKNRIAKWMFRINAQIDYSITPISKSLPDSDFSGTKFRLFQSNMLGGDGSKIFSVGLGVGLIYCL